MTSTFLFTGGKLLDAAAGTLKSGLDVLVANGRIASVGASLAHPADAVEVPLAGRTLMPGLIDCHVHVVAETLDLWDNAIAPSSLAALRSARVMK